MGKHFWKVCLAACLALGFCACDEDGDSTNNGNNGSQTGNNGSQTGNNGSQTGNNAECTANEKKCENSQVIVCANGKWTNAEKCPNGCKADGSGCAAAGESGTKICDDKATKCEGDRLYTCANNSWGDGTACLNGCDADGKKCSDGGGTTCTKKVEDCGAGKKLDEAKCECVDEGSTQTGKECDPDKHELKCDNEKVIACEKDSSGKYVEQTVDCGDGWTCASFSSGDGCVIVIPQVDDNGDPLKEGVVDYSCKVEEYQKMASEETGGLYPMAVLVAMKANDGKLYGAEDMVMSLCAGGTMMMCQIDQKDSDYVLAYACGKSCSMKQDEKSGIYYGACDVPNAVEPCNEKLTKQCAEKLPESPLCYTEPEEGFGYCAKACKEGDEDEVICNKAKTGVITNKCENVSGTAMRVGSIESCKTKCDDSGDAPVCK